MRNKGGPTYWEVQDKGFAAISRSDLNSLMPGAVSGITPFMHICATNHMLKFSPSQLMKLLIKCDLRAVDAENQDILMHVARHNGFLQLPAFQIMEVARKSDMLLLNKFKGSSFMLLANRRESLGFRAGQIQELAGMSDLGAGNEYGLNGMHYICVRCPEILPEILKIPYNHKLFKAAHTKGRTLPDENEKIVQGFYEQFQLEQGLKGKRAVKKIKTLRI